MSGLFNLIDENKATLLHNFVLVSYTNARLTSINTKVFDQVFQECKKYTMFSLDDIVGILEFETQIDCLVIEVRLGFKYLIPAINKLIDNGLKVKDYSIGIVPKRGDSVICPNYADLVIDFNDFNSDTTNQGYKVIIVIFASELEDFKHPTAQEVLKAILPEQ
jgi:hypothetical protein